MNKFMRVPASANAEFPEPNAATLPGLLEMIDEQEMKFSFAKVKSILSLVAFCFL